MEPMVMAPEELREYIRDLPEDVILRVTVQEDADGAEETETV